MVLLGLVSLGRTFYLFLGRGFFILIIGSIILDRGAGDRSKPSALTLTLRLHERTYRHKIRMMRKVQNRLMNSNRRIGAKI